MSSNHSLSDMQTQVRIHGMHCTSCEILLERKLKTVRGIKQVSVNHCTGIATLKADGVSPPSYEEIESAIRKAGYYLQEKKKCVRRQELDKQEDTLQKWMETGGALLIIFAIFKLLSAFNLVSLAPSTTGVLSFGGIFLIGLVAGTSSCLAVTGGLLLAAAAKYNETNQSQTAWEKLRPLLQFNIGRLASYFLLGGIVGIIGRSITLSPVMTGYLNVIIGLVMLSIALSILKVLPKGGLGIKPPKALSHWIHDLAENKHPIAPFALGALTFFLPCGFTQSLQLVALASGGFWTGAMTMFIFALGTLPALLSISAISSVASGTLSRLFLRFAGTLVLMLSIFNLQSALVLAGFDIGFTQRSGGTGVESLVNAGSLPQVANGVQEVSMKVESEGYVPNIITVKAGVPVHWVVDGTNAGGCNSSLVIPALNISRILEDGPNVIEFIPTQPGKLLFSCSMGMYRGYFNVL